MRNKVLQKRRKIEDERRPQRQRREDRLFSRAGSVPPVPEFRRPHVRFSSLGSDDRGGCFVGPRYAAWVRPQGRLGMEGAPREALTIPTRHKSASTRSADPSRPPFQLSLVALDLEDVDVTARPVRIHGNTPGTSRDVKVLHDANISARSAGRSGRGSRAPCAAVLSRADGGPPAPGGGRNVFSIVMQVNMADTPG